MSRILRWGAFVFWGVAMMAMLLAQGSWTVGGVVGLVVAFLVGMAWARGRQWSRERRNAKGMARDLQDGIAQAIGVSRERVQVTLAPSFFVPGKTSMAVTVDGKPHEQAFEFMLAVKSRAVEIHRQRERGAP